MCRGRLHGEEEKEGGFGGATPRGVGTSRFSVLGDFMFNPAEFLH